MSPLHILLFSIAGTVVGYALARLPGPWRYLSAAVPAALFVAALGHLGPVSGGGVVSDSVAWVPSLGVELAVVLDGFSLMFALLITGIGTLVTLYATAYFAGSAPAAGARFVGLILAFMTAMLGAVLSDNLIVLYVFWEATSLTSFLLIGFEAAKGEARKAAWQSLLVTMGGGLALFGGILLIGMELGTFSLAEVAAQGSALVQSPYLPAIVALLLLGAFTKSAQFPFHFWLPQAMAAPTPASAYLHSATMVKLGVYLLARFDLVLVDLPAFGTLLVAFGLLTMLVAATNALRATEIKALLAHSTVASLGILVLLIGLDGPAASVAVVAYTVAHALFKAALFFCAGTVISTTGLSDLRQLGGLANRLPLTAVAAVLAGLSMAGLPPLVGFIAKEYLFEAQLANDLTLVTVAVSVLVNAVMVAVAAAVVWRTFFRRLPEAVGLTRGETPGLIAGPLALGLLGLFFGLAPQAFANSLALPAASALHGSELAVSVSLWHGFTPMLALSGAVVALGALLAWRWDAVQAAVGGASSALRTARLDANRGYERSVEGVLSLARASTALLQNGDQRRYTLIVSLTLVAVGALAVVRSGSVSLAWSGGPVDLFPIVLLLVGLAGALVAVRVKSLIAGVIGVGAFGYVSALIFLVNGAPDLALTQFAVETLVLVILTAVLVRLPTMAPRARTPRERSVDAVVAAGFAVLVFVGLASMVAQPFDRFLSDYYGAVSYLEAFGRNVVNVIIVDFRGLDTLGEISVVTFATLGVWALLRPRGREGPPDEEA